MPVDTMLFVFSYLLVFMFGYQLGYGRYRRSLLRQQKILEGMQGEMENLESALGELCQASRSRPSDSES